MARVSALLLPIAIFIVLYLIAIGLFASGATSSQQPPPPFPTAPSPPTSPTPTTPTAPSAPSAPTSPTPTPPSVPTLSPPPTVLSSCKCPANNQPLYNTFPHPQHTDQSFAVFNFFNHNGVARNGSNLTVWVTVSATADARMQQDNAAFVPGFDYVYVDAHQLQRGESFSFVIPKSITANGRIGGGRIYVYYENPLHFDELKHLRYGGSYPVQTPGNIQHINDASGSPQTPSNRYAQLLEFTMDVDPGTNVDTQAFIDYDLSAVDQIALPVYIFGGYDPRTLPDATSGPTNHGFPCGKAYIGCQTPQETVSGCPTQIRDDTLDGQNASASVCIASFPYCELPEGLRLNASNWNNTCHKFDAIAAGFNVTQEKLDLFLACVRSGSTSPPCPPVLPPIVTTPSNVIYGCVGQFLLENHCLLDGSRYMGSTLDGTQCSALNRGLCFEPDFRHVPLPDGLSCSRFRCPDQPVETPSCMIHCYNYSCFGWLCANYNNPFNVITDTCNGELCTFNTLDVCVDNTQPISKSRVASCNDSTADPYQHGLLQNDYAEWVRGKGERFYGFSLDEEVGGGNQQCLYSTQLDVVIFPSCGGTFQ